MNDPQTPYSIRLTKRTWLGVLIHLKDTVDNIPVSTIVPDPFLCVHKLIDKIEEFAPLNDYNPEDLYLEESDGLG